MVTPTAANAPPCLLWDVRALGAWLDDGGVLACPTESVYGLVADAADSAACARIVAAKAGRASKAGMPLIVADADSVHAMAYVPQAAAALIAAFWPGPLTLVVPARAAWPASVMAPDGTIAVRVSAHPLLSALAQRTGRALTATSANKTGHPATPRAREVRLAAWERVAVVAETGALPPPAPVAARIMPDHPARPSTLVRVGENGSVVVVRAGAISAAAIGTVIAESIC